MSEPFFLARIQEGNRVVIPVEVRRRFSFMIGDIIRVGVSPQGGVRSNVFYGTLLKDYRITIPFEVRESLELSSGMLLNVTLEPPDVRS